MKIDKSNLFLHPNGFLQLWRDPTGASRIHIWHPDIEPAESMMTIHNHIFDFESKILFGSFCHTTFKLNYFGETHETYLADYRDPKHPQALKTETLVSLTPWTNRVLRTGERYHLKAGVYHSGYGTEWTATSFYKTPPKLKFAEFFVPRYQDWDLHNFDRSDYPEAYLKIAKETYDRVHLGTDDLA